MLDSLRRRYEDASLQRKIALVMGLGGILVTAAIAVVAYVLSRQLIVSNTQSILTLSAQQYEREIVLRLESALALASSLSKNTVTANALSDTLGRTTYLSPLLSSQNLPFAGANLLLTDYRGQVVAKASPDSVYTDEEFTEIIQTTLNGKQPTAFLTYASQGKASTLMAVFPVTYRLTGEAEGAVVLTIPVSQLLHVTTGKYQIGLIDEKSRLLAGSLGNNDSIGAILPIEMPPPFNSVSLSLGIHRDRAIALHDLDRLFAFFVAIGAVLLMGVTIVSRGAARLLSRPLSELSLVAERISQTGRPEPIQEVARQDEMGSLARAFQRMLIRLTDSYSELESRVEQRTEALRESEKKLASILASLHDAVWSLSPNGQQLIYLSPSLNNVTGIDPGSLEGDLAPFMSAVHPDELDRVNDAMRRLIDCGEIIDFEFRFVNPKKGVRILRMNAHPQRNEDGVVMRLDGVLSDVTERREAEEKLRKRELYLRATLDNFPFMVWLKDSESHFLAVNQRFAEAVGCKTTEELRGLSDFDTWPATLADKYREDDQAVMLSSHETNVEEPIFTADGIRWFETFKKRVITPEGEVLGTVGFARDVTERRQMQRLLAESEERWELAVIGSNDGIWDWDVSSGQLFLSDRWKSMLGYRPEEISGQFDEWQSRVHPDDLNSVMREVQRHLAGESEFYQAEHRVRCKDGGYKWILARGKAIRNDAGQPTRFLGSHSDIHERVLAENGLKLRTAQLNAIFALSPDGFIAFGENGLIEYASAAMTEITGLEPNNIYGMNEEELLALLAARCSPESRNNKKVLAMLCRTGGAGDAEANHGRFLLELQQPDSRVVQIGYRQSTDKSLSKIFYFRDVTHESEVDRLKSEFLSTAAHELRTPMVSILGFSELLLNDTGFDPATTKELINTINRQSTLMASIINELLDLARIEARRGQDFVIKNIDLCALVRDSIKAFRFSNDVRPVMLNIEMERAEVEGDCRKITQAINNVLSNAYKYSPGGGEINLRVFRSKQPTGEGVSISIRDHGIGMSPESQARIYERFFRADTSGAILGTGLGMSIVKEIVELHGGTVAVSSVLHEGTEVVLWFPCPHNQLTRELKEEVSEALPYE